MSLRGASQFRSRLNAIQRTGRDVAREWADEDVRRVRSQIQRRTGKTGDSIRADAVTDRGATVVGSKVVGYLARGTRAHEQVPVNARAMRFKIGGRTIFTKKVHHPATRGNPKILDAAQEALTGFANAVYNLWNRAA